MDRYRIGDYDTLPIFLKPKELSRIIPVSEPVIYDILNKEGCPKVYIGKGKACIVNTKKFIEWLNTINE